MRKIFYLLLALLIWACGASGAGQPAENKLETSETIMPHPDDAISEESVGTLLKFLTADELKGRDAGKEGIEVAARYIEDYFKAVGVQPYFETYRDTLSNFNAVTTNVVGMLPGNDPDLKEEWVILGAHYDHIGAVDPVNGDYIANGANDNASGTVAVMEIAKALAREGNNKRSVMIVLFSAEEKGLKGSRHLAEKLKNTSLNIYAMLNFEMIGVPMKRDYLAYLTGYKLSNMAEKLNEYGGEDLIGFLPQAKQMNLFKRSDNYPFYTEFDVPAQTVCTFDFTNFDYYHQPGDEFEQMDLKHMSQFITRMIPAVQGMVNSEKGAILMQAQ